MLVAIIGGRSEDEQHLSRIAAKAGHDIEFYRHVLPTEGARDSSFGAEDVRGQAPRALVFEAFDSPDLAVRALRAVRNDPYFDGVGTLIALKAEQVGVNDLPGGFDDFVLYPWASAELSIRIRAVGQRRAKLGTSASPGPLGIVDDRTRDVYVDGHTVRLTARELALFSYFCQWRGKVLSREHLLARVWGSRYSGGPRTVDIHVRRLRAKLGSSLPLETLRGSGYRLRNEAEQHPSRPTEALPLSKVS
jgi:DNA-binding response OmpR family regulator